MKFYVLTSLLIGLLTGLLHRSFAVEEETEALVHLIEKINEPDFPNSASSVCKAECKTVDPLQQCAVDLCGFPGDNARVDYLRDFTNDNFDKFNKYDSALIGKLDRRFDQEIKPAVLQTIRIRAKKTADLISQEKGQNPDKEFMEQLKQLSLASEDRPVVFKAIQQCKSRFITDGVQEEKIKQFKNKYKQYIQRFLNKVFANYSPESRQSFENYINNKVVFQFPTEDTAQGFKKVLKSEQKQPFHSYTNFTDMCRYFYIQGRPLLQKDKVEYSVFGKQKIKVSVFSCQFHEHGKQILSHELAHLMDYYFTLASSEGHPRLASSYSYKQYMKLRKCARKRYINDKTKSPWNIFHPLFYLKDKQQTAEILADLLAYLAFQEEPELFSCIFFPINPLMEYDNLTMYNNNKTNRHPAPVLRAVMEAIHKKKKLSYACRQVMDQYKNKINFQPCF